MGRKRLRGERGKPWYWAARDGWFITEGKSKVALRDKYGEPVKGKDSEEAAIAAWHERNVLASVPRQGEDNTLRAVFELYLQDLERRAAPKTHRDYVAFFKDFLAKWPGLLVRDLKPFHVTQWWDSHPAWGPSMKNITGTALKAALNWAAKPGKSGGIIPRNPLDGMPLPPGRKRSADVAVSDDEFAKLLSLVTSPAVRDVLTVLWHTGTRPGNLAIATAANLTPDGDAFVFDAHNTPDASSVHKTFKKTGRALIVPLPDAARDVCVRLREKRPAGPLFLTARGLPWNKLRLANTVRHYAKRAGLEGRFMAYSCRHSRATSLLEAGVADHDVAALLGNTPAVIHKNYSHVAARVGRLLDLANKHAPKAAG